jgi:CRP/FNR family transcriptional regulator, cyclic AMP receptor protein
MRARGLDRLICEHPFFAGLASEYCELISSCARNTRIDPGGFLFREGAPANEFFVIRHGHVALEIMAPEKGPLRFLTLGPGDIAGVAWLVPPYRWVFDAQAVELTRAVAIDARCLRDKAEGNHDFGYELMKRFMTLLVQRLHAAHLQMLDVYGGPR